MVRKQNCSVGRIGAYANWVETETETKISIVRSALIKIEQLDGSIMGVAITSSTIRMHRGAVVARKEVAR